MEDQTQMNASASICTCITCLPREILVKILTGLPAKCAVRLRCSCKFLYSYIPEPRLAFRILFVLPSSERPALRLYSVSYSEESHGRLQAVDSAQQLDSRGLVWSAGSSCGDGKMCMLREETGAGALFDLSTGRRISLPPHRETYFSSCGSIIGNGDFVVRRRRNSSSCTMICSFAAVGFDSISGRCKVFKSSTVYYDRGRVLNRQWVLTLEVDKSWREIKPTITGYTDAAVHIRGIIYFIPQITDESSKIVAMDVARERFIRLIPFPSEYESLQRQRQRQRERGWVPWIKLNGRLAFINIIIPAREDDGLVESKIEIWTLEIKSKQVEWGKQTVLVPLEESEAIGEATPMGFTSNSMGEIVFLLFLNKMMSPLIFVYSFGRDVWKRVEIGGVSKYSLYLSDMGGVIHIDNEIATSFLE